MPRDDIRSSILLALAELYDDVLSRRQFKRFTFEPKAQTEARELLRRLATHLLIELKGPDTARLTDVGYQLLQEEIRVLRRADLSAGDATDLPPPDSSLVDRLVASFGETDFVSASRLVGGRFITYWATGGFQRIIGYSPTELESAGGWPVVLPESERSAIIEAIELLMKGEQAGGELLVRPRFGDPVRLQFLLAPVLGPDGRLVGTVSANRVARR